MGLRAIATIRGAPSRRAGLALYRNARISMAASQFGPGYSRPAFPMEFRGHATQERDGNSFPALASRCGGGSPDPAVCLTEGLLPQVRLGDSVDRVARSGELATAPLTAARDFGKLFPTRSSYHRFVVSEFSPQLLDRPAPDFARRLGRATHTAADLLPRELLHVPQSDGLAVMFGQPAQGLFKGRVPPRSGPRGCSARARDLGAFRSPCQARRQRP